MFTLREQYLFYKQITFSLLKRACSLWYDNVLWNVFRHLIPVVPVILEIDKIDDDFEPNNKTIRPTDFWGDIEDENIPEENPFVKGDDDLPF